MQINAARLLKFTVQLRQLQLGLDYSTEHDARVILDSSLLELAGTLAALPLTSAERALGGIGEPTRTLARFHWRRHQALPASEALADMTEAIRLFTDLIISGNADEVVPAEVRTKIAAALEYATEPPIVAGIVLADLLWHWASKTRDLTILGHGLSVLEELADTLPRAHRAREVVLSNMCVALRARAETTGSSADTDQLITVAREVVAATPRTDPRWTNHAFTFTDALRRRAAGTGNLADLNECIEVTAAWARTEGDDPGAVLLSLNGLLIMRYEQVNDPQDLDWAVDAGRSALRQLTASPSSRPETLLKALLNLAQGFQLRFGKTRENADLDEAVKLWSEAIPLIPHDHPDLAVFRSNFGAVLLDKFEATQEAPLLDEAIRMGRSAVAKETAAGKRHTAFLSGLARSLSRRFERTHNPADLDELVTINREQLTMAPSDALEYSGHLMGLATRLNHRYDMSGHSADLDEAISLMRDFVTRVAPDHPEFPAGFTLLCQALRKRSASSSDLADLNEAITNLTWHAGIQSGAPLAYSLLELGNALQARAELTNDLSDLDSAVDVMQKCAESGLDTDDYLGAVLRSLSVVSRLRFERTADAESLKHAIRYARRAVEVCERAGNADSSAMAHNSLGSALSASYELNRNVADLDAVIGALQTSLSLTSAGSPLWITVQSNLGYILQVAFDNTGNRAHLDDAVRALRAAAAVPRDTASDKAITLTNLAGALLARYRHFGAMSDLDETIHITRSATQASPRGHRNLAMAYNSLCAGLLERFDISGNGSDLEDAIGSSQAAIESLPLGHPDLSFHEANLAGLFYRRYKLSGERTDLEKSINLMRTSSEKTSVHANDYPARLTNLGLFLGEKFKLSGEPDDLEAAIHYERSACSMLPDDHPLQAVVRSNLGSLLQDLYQRNGNESVRDEALDVWRRTSEVTTAPPHTRLDAARARGHLAATSGLTQQAAAGLSTAVHLLPLAAWHGTALRDRERQLSGWQGLARDAAAWAVSAQHRDQAIDLLELGRTVLWNQILHIRGDLADLRDQAPQLVDALDAIRVELASPELTLD